MTDKNLTPITIGWLATIATDSELSDLITTLDSILERANEWGATNLIPGAYNAQEILRGRLTTRQNEQFLLG